MRAPEQTVLYQVVAGSLPRLLARTGEVGSPAHVRREVDAFLGCGLFERGATAFWCPACGDRTWVAFKGRGFCPSCCARRMNDIAAH